MRISISTFFFSFSFGLFLSFHSQSIALFGFSNVYSNRMQMHSHNVKTVMRCVQVKARLSCMLSDTLSTTTLCPCIWDALNVQTKIGHIIMSFCPRERKKKFIWNFRCVTQRNFHYFYWMSITKSMLMLFDHFSLLDAE